MNDLTTKRDRLAVMAEIEELKAIASRHDAFPSLALACLERADRLADELKRTENGGAQ